MPVRRLWAACIASFAVLALVVTGVLYARQGSSDEAMLQTENGPAPTLPVSTEAPQATGTPAPVSPRPSASATAAGVALRPSVRPSRAGQPAGGSATTSVAAHRRRVADDLALSTFGNHEGGALPGVPSNYDWAKDSNNPKHEWPFRKWINVWGQAAVSASSTGGLNARLRLQRPVIYFQDASGRWTRAEEPTAGKSELWTSTVTFPNGKWTQGGEFAYTYDRDSDTWLIDMKQFPKGTVPHWAWNSYYPRLAVPADARAIVTTGYARLEGPDAGRASYVLALSSDHFDAGERDSGTTSNPAIGLPRHKRVGSDWRLYGFSTLDADALRRNPPPVPRP